MKRYIKSAAIIIAFLGFHQIVLAQKPKKSGCNDATLKAQVESLKQQYLKQNMVVFQEAMMSMISMEPKPVAVKLQQGKLYHMIFVGSQEANKLTLEVFDGKDKRLDEKSVKGSPNYIVYSFMPPKTDVYLVMLTQKRGAKDLCGSFTVMMPNPRPRAATSEEPVKPAAEEQAPVKAAPKTNSPVTTNPRYRPNVIKKTPAPPVKQH